MEEHYIKDVGKITYVYGVNLEEHKTVIEKQQKRIAELEQELSELKTKYEDCENERLQNRIEYLTMKNKWLSTEKELAELKQKAIVPRFKRQEIVYCFSYGKIQLFNVVAYLDNQITLCENRETGKLEFVDNNYLCLTEQEAQAKLQELRGGE